MNAKKGFQFDSVLVRSSDGVNFTLIEPIDYITEMGARLTIPAGTTTDGASVPRALWRLLPPFGKYWMAAILRLALPEDPHVEEKLRRSAAGSHAFVRC